MIFEHNEESLKKDLERFLSMTENRAEFLSQGENKLPEAIMGANITASLLHPEYQQVKVVSGNEVVAVNGRLASFQPGQFVFLTDENGNKKQGKFFMVSSPESAFEGKYRLRDYSEKSIGQIGETVTITQPLGLQYYQPIRDGKHITVIGSDDEIINSFKKYCGADCIEDASPENVKSIFAFYPKKVSNEIKEAFPGKNIRFIPLDEASRNTEEKPLTCRIITNDGNKKIPCSPNESVASILARAGIIIRIRCDSGECGYCRCRLLEGEVFTDSVQAFDTRPAEDIEKGFIHSCCTFPETDITIKI